METRQKLIDMVRGTRSGYWVEVLHAADGTGNVAYMFHFPYANGAAWDDMPIQPATWEAVRVEVARHLGRADAADTLPKFDERRRYTGDVMDVAEMAAITKWAQIKTKTA